MASHSIAQAPTAALTSRAAGQLRPRPLSERPQLAKRRPKLWGGSGAVAHTSVSNGNRSRIL
jgi:hypothetical protein